MTPQAHMTRPVLLDLFCGAGGAAAGYSRAGFRVIGVDSADHAATFAAGVPGGTFVQADWRDGLERYGSQVDAVHASPPCQAYTWYTRADRAVRFPMYVDAVRDALQELGRPWVIENVMGARLRDATMLCGRMFGLGVIRHRLFESSVMLWPSPGHPRCVRSVQRGEAFTVVGHGGDSTDHRTATWQRAMDID